MTGAILAHGVGEHFVAHSAGWATTKSLAATWTGGPREARVNWAHHVAR